MSNKLARKEDNRVEETGVFKVYSMLRSVIDIVVCIYILLVVAVMPFYFSAGYSFIGSDKYTFFKNISTPITWIIIPLSMVCLAVYAVAGSGGKTGKRTLKERGKAFTATFSVTDKFAICYGIAVILSYLFSDYRATALWGERSWNMGMISQLTFVGIYFYISRLWGRQAWLPKLFLPVTMIVFALAYLNRFGIYPIEMESRNPSFISTIGNINWYCGYMVTVFFGGVYLLWNRAMLVRWQKVALFIYAGIGFASLVTQGSSSGILTLFAVLFLLFLMSVKDGERMRCYLEIVMVLAAACLFTYMIRLIWPDAITYREATNDLMTFTPLPLLIAALAAGMWLWVRKSGQAGRYPVRLFRILGAAAVILTGAVAVLFTVLLVMNTIKPGSIGALSGKAFLTFGPSWGSNRGATWMAGAMIFGEQSFLKKLVGVGPDCMYSYIANHAGSDIVSMVKATFYDNRLTNAHNEWLTILVNTGMIGAVGYVGMIVSAIVRFLKMGNTRAIVGAAGLSVLAYTVNNMVSFQQAMSTVTLFVILGMGEAYAKEVKLH